MLILQAGPSRVSLAPEIGGAIAGWTYAETPVLRPDVPPGTAIGARALGSFPLVPYSNRIGEAAFSFRGVQHPLARNNPPEPHAIHGVGWNTPWEVAEATPVSARLRLVHDGAGEGRAGWPFSFVAEQAFSLTPDALVVAMSVLNTDSRPAPAGMGLHPFFPKTAGGERLHFSAEAVWLNGADKLPAERVPVPAEWDHAAGQPVGTVALDNCFAGWDGLATIATPTHHLAIEASEAFRHLVVFIPKDRPFFAVEPVSHCNDAVHRLDRPDTGLRVLEPGEILTGTVRFAISGVSQHDN